MTLAKRIIPSILVRGKTAYKGQRFDSTRSIGSALAIAQVHARRGVDELMILDISATAEGRGPDLDLVRELSEGCFIPITVGGGVRSLKDIDALLRAGADKVAICTKALEWMPFINEAADRFGGQAIVVSLDVRGNECWSCCGSQQHDSWEPSVMAQMVAGAGAGEILLTSIDRDGTMQGYDLDLIREVSTAVSIPVIASGGCGSYADMLAAFKAGADACASGAMFAFSDETPKGAARFLQQHGIPVRI
jgi:cyclase